MRILLALLATVSIELSVHGQGAIDFTNAGPSPEHRVYIDEWLNPSALAPGGRQFLVALYFARIEDGESSLTQVGDAAGFVGSPDRTGIFFGGSRTVPTTLPGQVALFQVKGWEAAYGNTYEQAAGNPAARVGQSPVFIADTVDPAIPGGTPNLIEASTRSPRPFQGFVIAVPEPSSGILILTGIAAIFVLHRKLSSRR